MSAIKAVSSTSPGLTLQSTASGGKEWEIFSTGAGNSLGVGGLAFYDNTTGAYRQVIDTNGNVGIGTTNPTNQFHLFSTGSRVESIQSTATNGIAQLQLTGDANRFNLGVGGSTAGTLTNKFFIYDQANGTRMVMDSAGNVDIATTNPAGKFVAPSLVRSRLIATQWLAQLDVLMRDRAERQQPVLIRMEIVCSGCGQID